MHLHGWLKLSWYDVQLKWNVSDHENVANLHMNVDNIWRPDLKLYNAPDTSVDNTLALVYSTGQVLWVPPMTAQVSCNLSATWFPFDEQRCTLVFGSWTHDVSKIDLQIFDSPEESSAFSSSEWRLHGVHTERHVKKYPCCKELFPSVHVTLTMRRRACKYIVQYMLPMVSLTLMGLLTGALVPSSRADLRLLVVTLLLAFSLVDVRLTNYGVPESVSALTVFNGQMIAVLFGLFACNCVHLAVQRCGAGDCSLLGKLAGMVSTDKSGEASLLSTSAEQRYQRTLDSFFTIPLTCVALASIAAFMGIPMF